MNVVKLLEKIGLEAQEAKVYLSTLTLGEAPVGEIAKHAGVVRTSCYYTLQKLEQKQIAHLYVKHGVNYWGVEGPEWLAMRIDERKKALDRLMPQLVALQSTHGIKPTSTYYEGTVGLQQILKNILADRQDLMSLCSLEDAVGLLGQPFHFFIAKRVKLKIALRFITNRSVETIEMQQRDEAELRQTHFLMPGQEIKNISFIYGDKIAILSLNRKMPMGIIIKDPDIAHTQRILFEALWRECSRHSDTNIDA